MKRSTSRSPRESAEEAAPLIYPVDTEASPSLPGTTELKKDKPWVLLCVLIFFLLAIVDVGAFLAEPPKTRVYEASICLRHYEEVDPSKIGPNGSVPEELCKEDVIQQRMAMIFGWQDTFDAIPGILLAVPFGTLADKYGRKWIFTTALGGLQLSSAWILLICYFRTLPLQLTWFSSAFFFIGGGPIVASALGGTMVSDIVPPEKRTAVFLYLTAGVLLAELVAPILAAWLMNYGDWLPLLLAFGIQQAGIFLALAFPETLHLRDLPEQKDSDEDEVIELQPMDKTNPFGVKAQIRSFKDAFNFFRRDMNVALVNFSFMANRIGRQALNMLIRYASKRYHWKIQKAAYLVSFRAGTNLLALTVLVPVANLVLVKLVRLPAHYADLWLARGSIILTVVSFVIMGIAAYPALLYFGLIVFNCGTGYNAAMRSVSIHVVGGQASPDIGRLFAVIAIVESIGVMFAGPILARIFEWGIDLGEPWIGVPYLGSAGLFAVITVITFAISVKEKNKNVAYTVVRDEEWDDADGTRIHQD